MPDKDIEVSNQIRFHKIKDDETLQKIAKKFEIPFSIIATANENIKIASGVTIVIPQKSDRTYTATETDTVEKICEKFGMTREEFQSKNGGLFVYKGMIVAI